ncbi:hypothetical protein, partial [Methylobacterium sp. D48H]
MLLTVPRLDRFVSMVEHMVEPPRTVRRLEVIINAVITQACDGRVQAPMVLRTVLKGLLPAIRAVSTTVRMAASPSA